MRQTQIRKSLIVRLPIERFVPRFEFTHKPHFISNIKIYQMHFSNYTAVSKHFPQTKYKIYISPQMYYIISDMKCTNRCWSFLLFSLFFNKIWNKREIKKHIYLLLVEGNLNNVYYRCFSDDLQFACFTAFGVNVLPTIVAFENRTCR